MAHSQKKGAAFEREIARDLNATYEGAESLKLNIKSRKFRRTPLSGGFRDEWSGDILVPDYFPFFVECKHRKDIGPASSLFGFLQMEQNVILQIWRSEESKARKQQRDLLLIFKRTSCVPLVMVRTEILQRVEPGLTRGRTEQNDMAIRLQQQALDVTVVNWEALLRRVSREALESLRDYQLRGADAVRAELAKNETDRATETAPERNGS